MVEELGQLLDSMEADAEVQALVVTGDSTAFSSGQDLKEVAPRDFLHEFNELLDRIEAFPKPSVAAIAGWCVGGGLELALCCDLRVASTDAQLGDFHGRIDSLGGGGATARLPRVLGMGQAKRLIFTGDVVDGHEAVRIGLVQEAHPTERYLDAATELADRLVPSEGLTTMYAKRSIHESADLPLQDAVQRSLVLQTELQEALRSARHDAVCDHAL